MEKVRERIKTEVESLQGEIAALMTAAVNVSSEALTQAQEEVVISGERNLLSVSDFSKDMGNLRRAFDLFRAEDARYCVCWTFPARPKACAFHRR